MNERTTCNRVAANFGVHVVELHQAGMQLNGCVIGVNLEVALFGPTIMVHTADLLVTLCAGQPSSVCLVQTHC
jgi:hypothetical protein